MESNLETEKQANNSEIFFEGFMYLRNSLFSKTKIFGSILTGRPVFYFTKAINVGDETNANKVSPVYLETALIKPDW